MPVLRSFDDSRMTAVTGWDCSVLLAGRGLGLGKTGRKSGAVFQGALDQKSAAMAVEDMLDQRQTEAGAALCTAIADVDAVKPLGQPRQVLGGYAGPEIAHRHADF